MPIQKRKFSFTLDLADQIKKVKPSKRKKVTELIAVTVIDSIENFLSRGVSPVAKGAFKKTLSPEYAKKTGKKIANLSESGVMLDDLSFANFKDKITFKITDSKEKLIAFNHNTGDTLPTRTFMPDDNANGRFKPAIRKQITNIINNAADES